MEHNRFGQSGGIPDFSKTGKRLTPEEKEKIANRKGICVTCGTKTHNVSVMYSKALNNDDVHNGVCIKCNPTKVPSRVLEDYEHRHPRVTAPVARAMPTRAVVGLATSAHRAKAAVRERHVHEQQPQQEQQRTNRNGSVDPAPGAGTAHGAPVLKRASTDVVVPKNNSPRTAHRTASANSYVGSELGAIPAKHDPASVKQDPTKKSSFPPRTTSKKAKLPLESYRASNEGFNGDDSFSSSMTGATGASGNNSIRPHILQEDYTGNLEKDDKIDIEELLQSIEDDSSNAELLKETLHRVRNLGYETDPRAAITKIQDIMDQYSNDPRVFSIACSALWRLTADDTSYKTEAAENGAIECIVDALRKENNLEDPEFLQWAIGCLASLAEAPKNKALIARIGGIETIVDVLSHHYDLAGVLEWSSRALFNLVHQSRGDQDIDSLSHRNTLSIEEANGIGALVVAMKKHHAEPTAVRWAMKLLWKMQDQSEGNVAAHILRKMRESGFVDAAQKILKASPTATETDLIHLSAELMCNVCISENSDSAYRDASGCVTTIVRILRESSQKEGCVEGVKQESCGRIIATLMNGTDDSRLRVGEAHGVETVLEAIEKNPDNLALIQIGLWTFWAMSCHDSCRDDAFIMRASQVIFVAVESQVEKITDLLLPVCGFFGNVCLIPGMTSAVIPIGAIVRALVSVENENILTQAERTVSNFCDKFPADIDVIVEALDVSNLESILSLSEDLSRSFCGIISAVASKSDKARGRMASPGVLESILTKLTSSRSPATKKQYLELLTTLMIGGTQKATRMPGDLVPAVLGILEISTDRDIKVTCCSLLRNAILSSASAPNVDGLVGSMISVIESTDSREDLKAQACSVLWALTCKYPRQDSVALADMNRCLIQILMRYKGDQGPFDYELLAMAAGALASVTNAMIHNPTHISSEDVDEIISVPYTALDYEADRTELYVRILASVYNLSFVNDATLIQCGVIVVVIDTMAEFEQSLEVQQFGCAILAVLASTENLQVNLSIVQTDGIDMIVNALALFSEDGIVQSQACKAISHLSIDEESRMLIASLGGLMLLGNTMRRNMEDIDLLEGALSAVLSLSADADVGLLTESDIIAVVVAVMRQYSASSQVQEFGMGVLQNISMRCYESKQAIADAGGIIAVAECVREFMGSPTVLERAFTTLWSLAVLDYNQALIAEADGISLVVNGMMTAITHEGVQKQGCGCLCTLSSDSRNKGLIQNVGGVDSIVFAMWAHYASEEIQTEACRALSSLAVDAQTNEVMIASDGEVNAIISAMRRFPVSARLQEHACVALRNFLLSADNVDIIRSNEDEVRMLIQQAASRFPDTCQERANQVLASLGP